MKLLIGRLLMVAILATAMIGESSLARSSRGGHCGKGSHGGRAHHHSARIGTAIVAPVWAPSYLPAPVYFLPEPSSPVEYIERDSGTAGTAAAPAYWYYCAEPQSFYPDIKDCPGGWQELVSQPPPAS